MVQKQYYDVAAVKAAHLREVIAALAATYSESAFVTSGVIPWLERSHASTLFALLSRSAVKIAHQPSEPKPLSRRLPDIYDSCHKREPSSRPEQLVTCAALTKRVDIQRAI